MAKIINGNEFKDEVLNGNETVLVDFFATWCGPCKMLGPVVEELSTEMAGKAKVYKVDVDKSPDIAGKYKITGVPTVMIFKNGAAVETMVGFQPKAVLKGKLEKYI
ncbi:thioredoxin [Acetobacterium fimetarium]|uniref:Thioredoxin n=1 Tax=Acetobacterium fimetarium TaxID=52691 RepID=A0ABR6WQZ9_9FIRM|nr:thioredoxin [Acetobacterium fimetarium]MBC3803043.1 thioredoxin [Acetobacterium fimetarium]